MLLLKETLKLSSDKRSALWYSESCKRDIALEMNNGYVDADTAIFMDSDFEEFMKSFGIEWCVDAEAKVLTLKEEGVSYIVDCVCIPNRFKDNLGEEIIFVIDTIKTKG